MLTADKLQKVQDARGIIEDAIHAIETLLDEEPQSQPPTQRRIALEEVLGKLLNIDTTLDQLWS